MYILNVGEAVAMTNSVVTMSLMPGSHFGDSIMTGHHKNVICDVNAILVCHVLIVTRESYSAALVQYPSLEAAQKLQKEGNEKYRELREATVNIQMRRKMVSQMLSCLGYEEGKMGAGAKRFIKAVFHNWLEYVMYLEAEREEDKKESLRLWDRQLWVLKQRDAHQRRAQKDLETIQHVWPPRAPAKLLSATLEAHAPSVLPRLAREIRPATVSQQAAWVSAAERSQMPHTAREWGNERRRALEGMYLQTPRSAQKSSSASGSRSSDTEEIVYRRAFFAGLLETGHSRG
jgi:hypothetical protein